VHDAVLVGAALLVAAAVQRKQHLLAELAAPPFEDRAKISGVASS